MRFFNQPRFWHHPPGAAATLLAPLGRLMYAAMKLRLLLTRAYKSPLPVICVGNVALGGSGKTPFVLTLVRLLESMGETPFVLTRGYGGNAKEVLRINPDLHTPSQVGEEALWLARQVPVCMARKRASAAKLAEQQGASVLVMDDGLQHGSLKQDLTFLLFDAASAGNGRLFPAGPLRETLVSGLKRAHALILVGGVKNPLSLPPTQLPRFSLTLAPAQDNPPLRDKKIIAFAGIARPERFFAMLEQMGAVLLDVYPFPDHHFYTEAQAQALLTQAQQNQAMLLTTEKDGARLAHAESPALAELAAACHRWKITVEVSPQPAFHALIEHHLRRQPHDPS